jgi:hypothetical protein
MIIQETIINPDNRISVRDTEVADDYFSSGANSAEIADLRAKLAATDYEAIKYAEGITSAEEYAPIKEQRQAWRDQINALEGTA